MSDHLPVNVDRVNGIVTTMLDTLASLAVAGGLGTVIASAHGVGAGMFFGGCTLATLSMVAQWRQSPRRMKDPPPGAHPHREFLPGPEDPGPVHVKGR